MSVLTSFLANILGSVRKPTLSQVLLPQYQCNAFPQCTIYPDTWFDIFNSFVTCASLGTMDFIKSCLHYAAEKKQSRGTIPRCRCGHGAAEESYPKGL